MEDSVSALASADSILGVLTFSTRETLSIEYVNGGLGLAECVESGQTGGHGQAAPSSIACLPCVETTGEGISLLVCLTTLCWD